MYVILVLLLNYNFFFFFGLYWSRNFQMSFWGFADMRGSPNSFTLYEERLHIYVFFFGCLGKDEEKECEFVYPIAFCQTKFELDLI